jgi:hypothetical protein
MCIEITERKYYLTGTIFVEVHDGLLEVGDRVVAPARMSEVLVMAINLKITLLLVYFVYILMLVEGSFVVQ